MHGAPGVGEALGTETAIGEPAGEPRLRAGGQSWGLWCSSMTRRWGKLL